MQWISTPTDEAVGHRLGPAAAHVAAAEVVPPRAGHHHDLSLSGVAYRHHHEAGVGAEETTEEVAVDQGRETTGAGAAAGATGGDLGPVPALIPRDAVITTSTTTTTILACVALALPHQRLVLLVVVCLPLQISTAIPPVR